MPTAGTTNVRTDRTARIDCIAPAPRSTRAQGRVTLVGAGPGEADLLTVRAWRAIESADAIVHDQLVGNDVLALARPSAELYYAGKRAGCHALPQAEINALLVRLARRGLRVVRLKGGDP